MAESTVGIVANIDEAQQLFRNLEIDKQKNVLRSAVRNAMKPALSEAQSNFKTKFKQRTKEGYKSIGFQMYRKNIGGAVGARLSGMYKGFYARFLDTGTVARFKKSGASTGVIKPTFWFKSMADKRQNAGNDLANAVVWALNKAIQRGAI